ncbi:hypothetical protein A0J61_00555 [Choanephora cucurbitarum]|uniref:Uncharacterized protein n=1 Tax=Choanephora cucurbitarum TaxID=101091 RepID=A0A1C7NQJ0_9FUNG|nr:hypothetical protein A0J61_09525 [Choanephora cucurbitarum]OBZ91391.1 hypothetical protein A0J61_00555 [Choanephora cucurbitarum]
MKLLPCKNKGKADVNERFAIFKSEDANLIPDPQQISQNFIFSGTDNGILHKRFAASTEQDKSEFQPLSEAETASAEDVGFANTS